MLLSIGTHALASQYLTRSAWWEETLCLPAASAKVYFFRWRQRVRSCLSVLFCQWSVGGACVLSLTRVLINGISVFTPSARCAAATRPPCASGQTSLDYCNGLHQGMSASHFRLYGKNSLLHVNCLIIIIAKSLIHSTCVIGKSPLSRRDHRLTGPPLKNVMLCTSNMKPCKLHRKVSFRSKLPAFLV